MAAPQECAKETQKQATHTNTRQEQHHKRPHEGPPNDHTKDHPPHLTTIEGGAATVRTTSHARVAGRAKVSVGGRVEVRRALGRASLPRGSGLIRTLAFTRYCHHQYCMAYDIQKEDWWSVGGIGIVLHNSRTIIMQYSVGNTSGGGQSKDD